MFDKFFGETDSKKIAKWLSASLLLLTVFLAVQVISGLKKFSSIGKEIYPQSTITVSGEGESYAIPDIATFNFSVTELGSTVKQAQEKADEKINKALALIRESGTEDKDIKTTGYNVYPKYEWEQVNCVQMIGVSCPSGKNVLKGYEVFQSITVKVRDTEKAGDLVTKIGALGVDNISGLEFTVDDRDKYISEAREEAIKKAKEQGKILAKQLGVKLGKVMYFNEMGNYMPTPYYYGEGMGGGRDMALSSVSPMKAELPTGETKITSQISITYEIK